MLKALAVIALVLLVAIVAILVYASTRPNEFRVVRSIDIKAPPETVFPLINDFRRWNAWSPYEKKDLAMKKTFSGAAVGKGAIYEWAGDSNVGAGRIEIIDEARPSRVTIQLDMIKPMEGHNIVDFTLQPAGDVTRTTWAMRGNSPYLAKLIGLFLNMDKMIGSDFENGLADLKKLAEQR